MNNNELEEKYRSLILSFIASLTLCDHMGDVADDADFVLRLLGLDIEWDEWDELSDKLAEMDIKTLHGTSLRWDDE